MLKLFFVLNLLLIKDCYGSETETDEIYGDEGTNLILPCKTSDLTASGPVSWRRKGRDDHRAEHMSIKNDNSLELADLSRKDVGEYTCSTMDGDQIVNMISVKVRTPPPALVNVSVIPSTILALLHWEVDDTGGYPITSFTAQYRLKYTPAGKLPDTWHVVKPYKISPSSTQIDIYQLEPNSSYVFQVWANNKLGRGELVELEAKTKHDNQEIELGKHLLEGVETFDTRVWVAAVSVVMGTLLILATATIYALYKEYRIPLVSGKELETMELIPNIILNPGFDYVSSDWSEPDENSNDSTPSRLNNNSVINPIRM